MAGQLQAIKPHTSQIVLTGGSKTALIPLACRAAVDQALRPQGSTPACRDAYRAISAASHGWATKLDVDIDRTTGGRLTRRSVGLRDRWCLERLEVLLQTHHPNHAVNSPVTLVELGCGLSTFAAGCSAWLPPASRWLALDEPPVLKIRGALKSGWEEQPIELQRLAEDGPECLAVGSDDRIVVIAIGFLMYLPPRLVELLFHRLEQLSQIHGRIDVLFDRCDRTLNRWSHRHPAFASLGLKNLRFQWAMDRPGELPSDHARWRLISTADPIYGDLSWTIRWMVSAYRKLTGRDWYACDHWEIL